MLDIYDRVGMVVMDENREFQVGEEYYHNQRDMVQRDRNHPSVVYASPFSRKEKRSLRPDHRHVAQDLVLLQRAGVWRRPERRDPTGRP